MENTKKQSTKFLAQQAVDQMTELDMTFAACEGCSAGGVAKIATSIPGASKVYRGEIVLYHEDDIRRLLMLDFDTETISESATKKMCKLAKQIFPGADITIATSGEMDPAGDAYVGILDCTHASNTPLVHHIRLTQKREANRQNILRAVYSTILDLLDTKRKALEIVDSCYR